MGDVVVTVRIPASLLEGVKRRTGSDHYADLSEQVRSVIRKGCMRYANPATHEIEELRSQLRDELRKEREDERTKALLESLKGLLATHGGEQR